MKGIILDINEITDSREIMESKEPPRICWFIYILLFILVSAVILSCFFELDEYSKVTGEVKTIKDSSLVLSPVSSKISKIFVEEGKKVKKGDTLFLLDADYAKEQYKILKEKQDSYSNEIEKTKLLKKSIEINKNLFKNNELDSKYYYRFEQYKNGVLITAEEADRSQKKAELSSEEDRNGLEAATESILEKEGLVTEYKSLIYCIQNREDYSGNSELLSAEYSKYYSNYKKTLLQCEQYKESYENILSKYNKQEEVLVSSTDVQNAKQEMQDLFTEMSSFKADYLSEIQSQIILLQNQLLLDSENLEVKDKISKYQEIKSAVEQDLDFSTTDHKLQNSYNKYSKGYEALLDNYKEAEENYESLSNKYDNQNSDWVTESQLIEAENLYKSAQADLDVLESTFISNLQQTINTLQQDLKLLEKNKRSLEISLKGTEDLSKNKVLSEEKLKDEALISVNSEIDKLKENISSIEKELTELKAVIDNSEIKATCNGKITFLGELNEGDIAESGKKLCNIVPTDQELKVNLYIPENAVSKIQIGQEAEYVFDALPYNEYGKITGKISAISADTMTDENSGQKYYIAQADISTLVLENQKGNIREIKNGMMVEAKIISGSKKVIFWLLEKINFIE